MEDKIKRLNDVMDKLGLTQAEFGEKVGITQTNVSAIFTGIRKLTKSMECRFILQYGINPEWMETGEGEMFLKKEQGNDEFLSVPRSFIDTISKQTEAITSQQRMLEKQTDTINRQLDIIERLTDSIGELKKTSSQVAPRECDAGCAAAG